MRICPPPDLFLTQIIFVFSLPRGEGRDDDQNPNGEVRHFWFKFVLFFLLLFLFVYFSSFLFPRHPPSLLTALGASSIGLESEAFFAHQAPGRGSTYR